jgi:phage N-6-adenine-methyltransferase
MAILVKSKTAEADKNRWATTWRCFNHAKLLTGYSFLLDVCAAHPTAKCANFIGPDENAFNVDWVNRLSLIEAKIANLSVVRMPHKPTAAWCNPPFDNKFEFINEVSRYRNLGLTVVMILPWERTTGWWGKLIRNKATKVFVPDGRYPFFDVDGKTQKSGVNFSSCFVEFSPRYFNTTEYVDFERSALDKQLKLGRAA